MCPQGHLLEGDESQAGQRCQCPTCGQLFIIPQPTAMEADVEAANDGDGFPGMGGSSTFSMEPEGERLLHIPCPNGHELETPLDMLGQEVLCPHCGVQFLLRERDSIEAKHQRAILESARLQRQASLWLNWAIVVAVLVGLGLVFAIWLVNSRG